MYIIIKNDNSSACRFEFQKLPRAGVTIQSVDNLKHLNFQLLLLKILAKKITELLLQTTVLHFLLTALTIFFTPFCRKKFLIINLDGFVCHKIITKCWETRTEFSWIYSSSFHNSVFYGLHGYNGFAFFKHLILQNVRYIFFK